MDLTNARIKTEAQKVSDMFYQQNSILDNVENAIEINFNLPKFGEFIHEYISHPQPVNADFISAFAKTRNTRIGRGALNSNFNDFNSPYTAVKEAVDYNLAIERKISETIDLCIELNDKPFEDFFREFQIVNVLPYTYQLLKFCDALERYEREDILSSFNKDFTSYITLLTPKQWHDIQFN